MVFFSSIFCDRSCYKTFFNSGSLRGELWYPIAGDSAAMNVMGVAQASFYILLEEELFLPRCEAAFCTWTTKSGFCSSSGWAAFFLSSNLTFDYNVYSCGFYTDFYLGFFSSTPVSSSPGWEISNFFRSFSTLSLSFSYLLSFLDLFSPFYLSALLSWGGLL